jgi:hypothetical protein
MRRYFQLGFSRAERTTRARTERTVRGLPERFGREEAAWRRAIRSRCQRSTVSGRTSNRTPRNASTGSQCSKAAKNARSPGANRPRWLPSCRCSTVISAAMYSADSSTSTATPLENEPAALAIAHVNTCSGFLKPHKGQGEPLPVSGRGVSAGRAVAQGQ